jgi:hypothetical protein
MEFFVMPDVGTNFHAMFWGFQFPVPGILKVVHFSLAGCLHDFV